ncbi:response regulator [Algoriphagus sp.]|uniref:Hpt domain-containing response regulator n=1 Tax=Algoriphagus sp. TaxID=1872435 RepID=UPI00328F1067
MKSKKVLIVESNDLNRKLFETLIGQLYSFEAVKSGREAVSKASHEKFDLILMDVQMPEVDGITTFKTIRRQSTNHCPILAVSSYTGESAKSCFQELGFVDLITKPIRPKEFLATIFNHLKEESKNPKRATVPKLEILDQTVVEHLLKYNAIPMIKSIYDDFLVEFDHLIQGIDKAFLEKSDQIILENLHTLKGNSGSLGANAIYFHSEQADSFTRSQDWDSLGEALRILKNERIIFENYLKEETTFKL